MDASSGLASTRHVFARQVHETMRRTETSLEKLAAATNIAPARIRRILKGEAPRLTLREMVAIAAALQTPLSALLAD